jgi:hypothetical protein
MASLSVRWRIVGAILLVGGLVALATKIAYNLATVLIVFAVGVALSGVVPFGLGFLVQLAVPRRRIGDALWLACAVVLMLPWWFWGKGFAITIEGPRIVSLAISVVYLTWFTGLGAAAARRFRRHAEAKREG